MEGSRSTRREPTHTRGEHTNSTQKGPRWGSNLEPSRCEAMVLTTTPPCSPSCFYFMTNQPAETTVKQISICGWFHPDSPLLLNKNQNIFMDPQLLYISLLCHMMLRQKQMHSWRTERQLNTQWRLLMETLSADSCVSNPLILSNNTVLLLIRRTPHCSVVMVFPSAVSCLFLQL